MSSWVSTGARHAAVFQGGATTDLGSLFGPSGSSEATGINDSGQVAGWTTAANGTGEHAFLDSGGVMTDLGAYNIDTVAYALNDHGVIVGQTYGTDAAGDPFDHAFIYRNGTFQDLNTLIPAGSGRELTDATAVNDNGQILVDAVNTANGDSHAFLLTPVG